MFMKWHAASHAAHDAAGARSFAPAGPRAPSATRAATARHPPPAAPPSAAPASLLVRRRARGPSSTSVSCLERRRQLHNHNHTSTAADAVQQSIGRGRLLALQETCNSCAQDESAIRICAACAPAPATAAPLVKRHVATCGCGSGSTSAQRPGQARSLTACRCLANARKLAPPAGAGAGCWLLAHESADHNKYSTRCKLWLQLRRRLAMGLSTVAGWGAFLHAPARKDQLLGEYTGELITQAEADRRCAQNSSLCCTASDRSPCISLQH